MSIRQLPSARWTLPGNSGVVPAGYYVYTYQPGTSTPKATYTDYTGTVANTNPVVLDARGEANIWYDGVYKIVVYTGDKDTTGVLVWSQDNYGEGTSSTLQGNFNLVLNGSFEDDANGDDLPDDWTIVEYTGGTVERDSLEQIHGTYALKFTSVGTGGGYADSTLFAVQGSRNVPVSFATLASIATVHNRVDIIWYTAAAAIISTTTLYDDTATNPTTWTTYSYNTTAPATARFAKIRLFGCKDDDTQAGITWFDNVVAEATTAIAGFFPNVNANVTASDEELNILDGVTATAAEINYADGPNAANKFLLLGADARVPFDQRSAFRGCLAYTSSNQSSSPTLTVAFGSEDYDTDSVHNNVTNNSRLTVPAGVSRVRVSGYLFISISGAVAGDIVTVTLLKNGNSTYNGAVYKTHESYANAAAIDIGVDIVSPVLGVSAGDYFTIIVSGSYSGTVTVSGASFASWFAMEIIG